MCERSHNEGFTLLIALHVPTGIQIRKERLKVKEFNIPFSKNGCMVQNLPAKICHTLIASKTIILDISVCSLPFTMKKFSINNEIVYWKIGSFACMYVETIIYYWVDQDWTASAKEDHSVSYVKCRVFLHDLK